jgi:hypothetical protein
MTAPLEGRLDDQFRHKIHHSALVLSGRENRISMILLISSLGQPFAKERKPMASEKEYKFSLLRTHSEKGTFLTHHIQVNSQHSRALQVRG